MYFCHWFQNYIMYRLPIQCFFKQACQHILVHIPSWILRPLIRQLKSVETFMGRALLLSHLHDQTQQKYLGFLKCFIHILFRPPIQCFFEQACQQIMGHIPTWILRPLIRQLISVETFMGRALFLSLLDPPKKQKYQKYIGFLIL